MSDEHMGDVMKTCEICKKEVKESEGKAVLGGAGFECADCLKKEAEHKHDEDGVCRFC